MFDLGVKAAAGVCAGRRLCISMTQVDQAKRGRYGSRSGESRCPAAAHRRPVAAPDSARGGRRTGRGRLSPGAGGRPRRCRPGPADGAGRREPDHGLRPELEVRAGQPGRDYRSDRRLRERHGSRLRRFRLATAGRPARLEHRARSGGQPQHEQRHRVPAGRPGLVPQALHAAQIPGRPADLGRVRRRVPQLERVPERQTARQPPLRLHRLQLRPDRPGAHRRRHRGRARGQRGRPAAEQPLVLRRRHLPQRLPGHHRAGPRGAARHLRDHARPARRAQLRLRDRPGRHRRHQRGVGRGDGGGGGDPHRPGGQDRRAGRRHGQRPRRADPDRDGQPESEQPRAVVHRPPPALHRANRSVRGRRRRRLCQHAVRHPVRHVRPGRGVLAQWPVPEDPGGRPARHRGCGRVGGALRRDGPADGR